MAAAELTDFVITATPEDEHVIVPAVHLANDLQIVLGNQDMRVSATAMAMIVALMAEQRSDASFLPKVIDYMHKYAETFLAQISFAKAKQSGSVQ
jgi:hypothetical protein